MPIYQVIVLAIVQSLTEFLPISSTAHLWAVPWLFGWSNPELDLNFDIALHAGTLIALVLYFLRDWVQVAAQGFGLKIGSDREIADNRNLLWMLAIATLPVGILGYAFKDLAETAWRNPMVIGSMLILVGIVMYIADVRRPGSKGIGEVTFFDSLFIGISQSLAIIPGVSRSGITISTGLFRDLDRHTAARFSFMLSTPALAGAALKAYLDLHKIGGLTPAMKVPALVGVLVSALTGYLVIAFFLRYLRSHSLRFFVYYRVIFGIMVIALAIFFRRAG